MTKKKIAQLFFVLIVLVISQCTHRNFERTGTTIKNGIILTNGVMNLKIQFYSSKTVRILKWLKEANPDSNSLVVVQKSWPDLNIRINESEKDFTLSSDKMKIFIAKSDGKICYLTSDSVLIISEKNNAEIKNAGLKDEKAYSVKQSFELSKNEGIYGLGQHQDGYMNYRAAR